MSMGMDAILDFLSRHSGAEKGSRYDLNATGVYHFPNCKYCGGEKDLRTLKELAGVIGARPCAVCKPPAYAGYVEG